MALLVSLWCHHSASKTRARWKHHNVFTWSWEKLRENDDGKKEKYYPTTLCNGIVSERQVASGDPFLVNFNEAEECPWVRAITYLLSYFTLKALFVNAVVWYWNKAFLLFCHMHCMIRCTKGSCVVCSKAYFTSARERILTLYILPIDFMGKNLSSKNNL